MGTIVITDIPLATTYKGGYKLIKFAVLAHQKLHIFFSYKKIADQLFQMMFHQQGILDHPVTEEGNGMGIHP